MTRDAGDAPTAPANELPFPLNFRAAARRLEPAVPRQEPASRPDPPQSRMEPRRLSRRRASATAAPATRRATCSARETARPRPSPAARPKAGTRRPSTRRSPAPVPWTSGQLFAYLRNGFRDPQHGVAAGPMAAGGPTTWRGRRRRTSAPSRPTSPRGRARRRPHGTRAGRGDGRGSAAQRALPGARTAASEGDDPRRRASSPAPAPAAMTRRASRRRPPAPPGAQHAVNGPDPRNLIRIILHGHRARAERAGPADAGLRRRADRPADRRAGRLPARALHRAPAGLGTDARRRRCARSRRGSGRLAHDHPRRQRHGAPVDADPATPLLYVLRDDLQLNGAKFGCGLGQCGACTVMVDGERGLLLRHAGRRCSQGREDHDRRRPRHRRQARARCSAPSSTSRRRNAATASPA